MELRRYRIIVVAVAVALAGSGAFGAAKRAAPTPQCPASGTMAVSFATVTQNGFVTDDESEVRLSGILLPGAGGERLRAGQRNAARSVLTSALGDAALTLAQTSSPDRYGRIRAQVFAHGGWLQEELLSKGEARANPDEASAPCAAALLRAEGEAREAKTGLWGDGSFAVRTPDDLRKYNGTFQIVEGTVVSASLNKERAYINFGPDYKTDFTVTISQNDMRAFRRAKFDVKGITGKRVRVRGWIDSYNGPEMEIATPAAIEILTSEK